MVRCRLHEMVCSVRPDICPLSMTDVESGVLMSATGLPVMNENIFILIIAIYLTLRQTQEFVKNKT